MTSVKVSTETRDRLKATNRGTADDAINAALDALDRADFWARAELATRARRSLPPDVHHRLQQQESDLDAAFEHLG